jgi:hypothetical protein
MDETPVTPPASDGHRPPESSSPAKGRAAPWGDASAKLRWPAIRWGTSLVAAAVLWVFGVLALVMIVGTYIDRYAAASISPPWFTDLVLRVFSQSPQTHLLMAAGLALLALGALLGWRLERHKGRPLHVSYIALSIILVCSIIMLSALAVWLPWRDFAATY